MKPSEILDRIFKKIQDLGPQPLISETLKAYKEAEKLIEDELTFAFNDGYEHRKKCEENAKISKSQNQN